ncbi:MAG: PAC2 family protein [Chloroflexi bacterium]|nr:PAC2 family protein [Chloroflexota bacterium]
MNIGAFELNEPSPELRQPHAISCLRPWIDVGSVGTLAISRLEEHLGAQELGRLTRPGNFFDFTRYRPMVYNVEDRRVFSVPNSVINYARQDKGPDLLFFHLLEPHAHAEEYTESVMDVIKHLGVKRHLRVGSMYDAVPHTRPLLVTGSSSNVSKPTRMGKLMLRPSTYQGPTTILNLVSQEVDKLGIENTTVLIHLPQYVQLEEDYAGAACLLEILREMYDLPESLADPSRGHQQYKEVDAEMASNPAAKAFVERMEMYYDSQKAERDLEQQPPLSPEVERFLRELDKGPGSR